MQTSTLASSVHPRSERLELVIAGVDAIIDVLRVDGVDALSEPYHFVVSLRASDELSVDDLVGRRALLELSSEVFPLEGEPVPGDDSVIIGNAGVLRRVSGILFSAETTPEPYGYRVALVCPLAKLALNRSIRIYQDRSSVEVVLDVLARNGVAVSTRLLASYERRDYCVQYRETDFHFVSRLLEEEGIAYHFEHRGSAPLLVLTDDPGAFADLAGAIVFRPTDGLTRRTESIHSLREHRELRPSRVSLADRNPRRPLLDLAAEDHSGSEDPGDVYDFFGKFGKSERAQRLARVRREELDVSRHFLTVASNSVRLAAGRVIRLVDHADDRLNGEHLVVRVEHTAIEPLFHEGAPSHYDNTVTLLPLDTGDGRRRAFRPARTTPRPVALGVHTASVDGQGQPVAVDELGRVKVRFHWDRQGTGSYWIRVSEAWAGLGYGTLFTPRDGQEVLVSFLEGDPDHPIIVGRVYNATQPLPDAAPTMSVIRTASVGGDGFNELRFEDRAGEELVQLRGERRIRLEANEHIALVVGSTRLEIDADGVRVNGKEVCTAGGHG
jgi:type VI secretion system secreted protein VgrG